jgi:hypothetical protein
MSKHKPTHIRTHAFGSEEEFFRYIGAASTSSTNTLSGYTTTEESDEERTIPSSQERETELPSELDEFDLSITALADHTIPLSENNDESNILRAPRERALEPPSEEVSPIAFHAHNETTILEANHTTNLHEALSVPILYCLGSMLPLTL